MKLYDFAAFPNPARVRIALHEKGATEHTQFINVDVPGGEHQSDAFRAINPSATVPVLELDCGTHISECTAITEYIDNAFDGPSLTGSTAKQRAIVHMMQRRAEQYVMDAVGNYFHHATDGLGADIEQYQNAEWGNRQKSIAENGLQYFNDLLSANEFVAGENFSMADITLFAGLGFAGFAKIDIPTEYTHLLDWQQRIAARPSVAALGG